MLEDTTDPRPQSDLFAQVIATRAAASGHSAADVARWLRGWHDREGVWSNLRNLEHWIDRADA
jgi:hypothetical protein